MAAPLAAPAVLAFGAGALISAVSFDLFEEGQRIGGPGIVAIGLAAGALTYFALDRMVESMGEGGSLALGALLDGIPEQMVLGIGLAAGEGVSVSLLIAIFVSNLPEAIGASADLREAGRRRRRSAGCGRRRRPLHPGDGGRVRDRRHHVGRSAGRDQRLRRRRAARDADRLDDPRGGPQGRALAGLITVVGFSVAAALS